MGENRTLKTENPQASGPRPLGAVARAGGWAGALGILAGVLRYGNSIVLTRLLGTRLFGLYTLAGTVVALALIPVGLGLPTAVTHFAASSASGGRWGRLRWVVAVSRRLSFAGGLLGALLLVSLAPWASARLFHKEALALPLLAMALTIPLASLALTFAGGLQGLQDIRGKVFVERIAHPLANVALLAAGAYFFRSLEYALLCYAGAAVFTAGWGAWLLRRRMEAVPEAPAGPQPFWGELFEFSVPVLFVGLLSSLIQWSDVLVMGFFRPAAEIGVYAVAARLALAINMPSEALGAALAPNFSGLMSRGDREGLSDLFHTSTRWLFLLGMPVCLTVVVGGKPLLHLFGRGFAQGYLPLCVLAAGRMTAMAFGANGVLITMTGHPKVNLVNSILLGSASLALGFLLVPRYGAMGAACATAVSMAVINAMRALEIRAILKIAPWDRTMLPPIALGAAAFAAGMAVRWAVAPEAGVVVGLAVYLFGWWKFAHHPGDIEFFRRFLQKRPGVPVGPG